MKFTHKGVYYFPTLRDAREFAKAQGYPTMHIHGFHRGYAIQGGVSGDYAGPHGLIIGDWQSAQWKASKAEQTR